MFAVSSNVMKELLKTNEFKLILIIAILVRFLVMPFFFHPDIKVYNFQASFLNKGVVNIYDYIDQHKWELPYRENFVYFPLTYFFLGIYQTLMTPFLGVEFDKWLFDASENNVSQIGIFRYLFILKLPYLILDVLIGFILIKFFTSLEDKKRVFLYWMLNPFSIYLIYVFSNVDIFVVFLTLLSLLFAKKNNLIMAAVCLGLGAGFKAYPLLFLPLLALYAESVLKRVLILASCLGVFFITIGPFAFSKPFINSALASGLTTRLFIPSISLGFGEMIILPVFVIGMYLVFFFLKQRKTYKDLLLGYLSIILIVLSFIHFHVQWLLWVVPFIVLILVKNRYLVSVFILLGLAGVMVPLLYNDKYMSVSLLNVISSSYSLLPSVYTVVQKIYDPFVLQSIVHSLFASLSFVAIYSLFKKDHET